MVTLHCRSCALVLFASPLAPIVECFHVIVADEGCRRYDDGHSLEPSNPVIERLISMFGIFQYGERVD